MFTFIRVISMRCLLIEQLPMFMIALAIAEVFYKFHSFLLETGAFLLTWFALDALVQGISVLVRRMSKSRVKTEQWRSGP